MSRSAIVAFACSLSLSAHAMAGGAKRAIHIPSGELAVALELLAKQSGTDLVYRPDQVEGFKTGGVDGELSTEEAVTRLLKGTPLTLSTDSTGAMLIALPTAALPNEAPRASTTAPEPKSFWSRLRLAQADASSPSQDGQGEDPEKTTAETQPGDSSQLQKRVEVEEVVVTGSNIRGVAPVGAQMITLDREGIRETGLATVQDVIRTLPQNFSGGPSEDTQLVGGLEALWNATQATGINLRGLGSGSTLTLVNGRRLAPAAGDGRFADLSGIPLSAIERIEVLTDGASAIYGADAVGGVLNVILRKDYEGAETQLRFGSVTDGDLSDKQIAQTFGTSWASGNALLAAEFYQKDSMAAADRRQSAFSDLTALGGSNFDNLEGAPGTIIIGSQTWAIPAGQDGTDLDPSDFVAGTVNLHNRNEGRDLYPRHERWSVVGTLKQEINERLSLFVDANASERETKSTFPGTGTTLTVPSNNPYYVNPLGGTDPVQVTYNFREDFGGEIDRSKTRSINAAAGATLQFGGDWRATGYFGYADGREIIHGGPLPDSAALSAALSSSDPATAFNAFGDGGSNSPAVLAAIASDVFIARETALKLVNVTADGPIAHWGGGEIKLAIGADFRDQNLDSHVEQGGVTATDLGTDRRVKSGFAEVLIPFVEPEASRAGLRRLDLSLAARYEDYSDFGDALSPKVGLSWAPAGAFSLHATWSESFKAPNLVDLDETNNGAIIATISSASGPSPTLIVYGNNGALQEETATTWTLGFEVRPLPSLSARFTYFDIDYEDRAQQFTLTGSELLDPTLAFLVTANPTAAQRDAICSTTTYYGAEGDCVNASIGAILDVRTRNVAVTKTAGVDLLTAWNGELGTDHVSASLNATYLTDFSQERFAGAPSIDLLDTPNNPLDLHVRGSLGWGRGQFGVTVFVNYVDGYTDNVSIPNRRVGSWTTADLQVRYETPRGSGSWLDKTSISLSVQNVLDEDPPFFNNPLGVGYDQQNADLLGRMISAQVVKEW